MIKGSLRLFAATAVTGCAVLAAPAVAAPTIVDFNLTAIFAPGAPINPLTGEFRVSFDNASDINATTAGLTITGLNIATTTPIKYGYNAANNRLFFADQLIGTGTFLIDPAKTDFGFSYSISTNTAGNLIYSYSDNHIYQPISTLAVPVASAVPEPAAWSMLILGMGAIGFLMRRTGKVSERFYVTSLFGTVSAILARAIALHRR